MTDDCRLAPVTKLILKAIDGLVQPVEGRANYSMDDHELGARRDACIAFLEECVQQHDNERYRSRLDS